MERNSVTIVPAEARTWAMVCHLAALVGLLGNGVGFILGPLIVWLIKRNDHPFIDEQGKEALNFQITMFIAILISAVLTVIIIGLAFLVVLVLLEVVMPVIAGVKANEGHHYRYPVTLRLIR